MMARKKKKKKNNVVTRNQIILAAFKDEIDLTTKVHTDKKKFNRKVKHTKQLEERL